jgi:hypothetical protein
VGYGSTGSANRTLKFQGKKMSVYILGPLPQDRVKKYSNLYHWTSVEKAISILETNSIYGCDMGQHANFAINKRSDVARFHEVLLHFKFNGYHLSMYGDTFGTKASPAGSQDTVYHLFVESDPSYWDTPADRVKLNYWQSNVYPGASGLEFVGIHCFDETYEGIPLPDACVKPAVWASPEKKNRYKIDLTLAEEKKRLMDLAAAVRGAAFKVP